MRTPRTPRRRGVATSRFAPAPPPRAPPARAATPAAAATSRATTASRTAATLVGLAASAWVALEGPDGPAAPRSSSPRCCCCPAASSSVAPASTNCSPRWRSASGSASRPGWSARRSCWRCTSGTRCAPHRAHHDLRRRVARRADGTAAMTVMDHRQPRLDPGRRPRRRRHRAPRNPLGSSPRSCRRCASWRRSPASRTRCGVPRPPGMTDRGLVDVVSLWYYTGLAMCGLGFWMALQRDPVRQWLVGMQMTVLIVVIHAFPRWRTTRCDRSGRTSTSASSTTSRRTSGVDRSIDVYHNWPGFFASVRRSSTSPASRRSRHARWSPVLFNLLWAVGLLYVVAHAHRQRARPLARRVPLLRHELVRARLLRPAAARVLLGAAHRRHDVHWLSRSSERKWVQLVADPARPYTRTARRPRHPAARSPTRRGARAHRRRCGGAPHLLRAHLHPPAHAVHDPAHVRGHRRRASAPQGQTVMASW